MSELRKALGQLGLGRLVYQCYHRPVGYLRKLQREGLRTHYEIGKGSADMEASVASLPVLPQPGIDHSQPLEVAALTGAKYWYQLAYCYQSLLLHAGETPLRLFVVDDGSLKKEQIAELRRLFPNVRFRSKPQADALFAKQFPIDRFPALNDQRIRYPHIRKMLDIRPGNSGWQAVIDSDMLFFARPDALLQWLEAPHHPLCLEDVETAYGYPMELLRDVAGAEVPERVNVGIVGLNNDAIDWELFERWTSEILRRGGTSYLLEQGLCALLFANKEFVMLPRSVYTTFPDRGEGLNPSVVLHHYVQTSKREYFTVGWRRILELSKKRIGAG